MKFSTKTQIKTHKNFLIFTNSLDMPLAINGYVDEFFTHHAIAAKEYTKAQDFLMLAKGSLNHHSVSRALDFFFQNLPSRKHADIAPQQLTDLAMGHTGRKGLRRLADYLVSFHEPQIKSLFSNYQNHTPIFYTIAEFLAQKTITQDDAKLLSRLIKLGNDDDLIAYSYLYAFKYVACTKPDLFVIDLVEPYINKVYELIPIISIFVSLAFEGNPKALEIKSNEFWSPIWEYNRREIHCLQAALSFKNLIKSVPAEASDIVALYRQQAKILQELNNREETHRSLVDGYWRLHLRINDLELLLPSLINSIDFPKWAFVLLTSYHWEVAETSAEYFATTLDSNSQQWCLILQWAFNTSHPAAWACIVAVQIKARETNDEDCLFACLKLHSEAEDAQLRGNAAHLLYQLLCALSVDELKAYTSKILPLIQRGLEDTDIWAIEESLTSNELLTSRGFQSLLPSNDSLLGSISNWQKLSDGQLSKALKYKKARCRT